MLLRPKTNPGVAMPASRPLSFVHRAAVVLATALALGVVGACSSLTPTPSLAPSPAPSLQDAPRSVRMTWFGVSNWTFQIGRLNILVDGYVTRIPSDNFYGEGSGLASTKAAWPIDKARVEKVHAVLSAAPGQPIDLILSNHSHFDHSFDTPYWARLTGARVIGPRSTCYQVQALGVPASQCTAVYGGETFSLDEFVTVRVVRWSHNHLPGGTPAENAAVELAAVPTPDAQGHLKAGITEDFPNGGGSRGYLFTVRTADGRTLAFFITNTGDAGDLLQDSVTDGIHYGTPMASLGRAMSGSKLSGVDLWIGAGGAATEAVVTPVLKPKVFLPNHLGRFAAPFERGMTTPHNDPKTDAYLAQQGIGLAFPTQFFDAWELDAEGVRKVDNTAMKPMKRPFGF
jgi:hypothetical protein